MVDFGSALSLEELDKKVISLENNSTPKAQLEKELLLTERERRENLPKAKKTKYPLILVVKNFIRDKKIIRLDLDTIKICESAGFTLKERLQRKLTSQSFWRIIYHNKFPDVEKIEFEDVLVFQRATSRPDGSI